MAQWQGPSTFPIRKEPTLRLFLRVVPAGVPEPMVDAGTGTHAWVFSQASGRDAGVLVFVEAPFLSYRVHSQVDVLAGLSEKTNFPKLNPGQKSPQR